MEKRNKNMKFYRYEAHEYAQHDIGGEFISPIYSNPKLELREFVLKKETPKGYWIGYKYWNFWKKWVSKTARKRYAYPTKEEAMTNYIKRTERRIVILKKQLEVSEIALSKAKTIKITT